ncbi:MAG: hypothetical protein HC849_30065 [Oscillatoriales cyanobacterium RU_3_3]|nr:hypothetical protein [Microcoleus sp. SU_5_3]NJM63454.1 hypothetical protein [Oscillatoriales cyanobacterium RU_3_3]
MKSRLKKLKFQQYRFTKIGVLIGLILVAIAHIFDVDYFEYFYEFLEKYESLEIDEILMLIFFVFPALWLDSLLGNYKINLQKKQMEVFCSTMFNVNHTINNLLNQLQHFYYILSEDASLTEEEIAAFYKVIKEADDDIKKLNLVENIPENLSRGIVDVRLG